MISSLFRKSKKDLDPLNPGATPGTRSVNNVPLFLGGAALLLFLAVMGYVMMQRAQQRDVLRDQEAAQEGASAAGLAADITSPWAQGGLTPPDQMQDTPPTAPDGPEREKNPPPFPAASPPEVSRPLLLATEERLQLRNARLQALQDGLRAKTGIQVQADTRAAQSSRPALEADAARRKQAGANDATAVYQARMEQLRGAGGQAAASGESLGSGGNARTDNSLGRYNRENRWELQQRVEAPASPYELRAGFIIPAIMISGINSNLPGQVMAQVSQNVYDTATGKHLLIPQGTRLVGAYNSDIAYGQKRVLMAWQRLVFPDGKALDIEAMPGADGAGMAGFEDQVNNHYFRTFTSAFLLSGVIAAVSMSQPQTQSQSNPYSNQRRASDALTEALGQTLGTTMGEMIRKNLNISPTIEIRPGYRFNVMATKDIVFKSSFKAFDY